MASNTLYTKKTILSLLKGKTVDQAILELKQLSSEGYGNCKIEISAALSSGPGYWKHYNGKIKCNILIPKENKC
jgi:hypothetical protein